MLGALQFCKGGGRGGGGGRLDKIKCFIHCMACAQFSSQVSPVADPGGGGGRHRGHVPPIVRLIIYS